MSGIGLESFLPAPSGDAPPADRGNARAARTRSAIVAACRSFMRAGQFRPPLQSCCLQAGRSIRIGFQTFGSVEALLLEAADDPPTRDAIAERVLGDARAALPPETLQRLVRAVVTGRG
jgi:hypothetical protein